MRKWLLVFGLVVSLLVPAVVVAQDGGEGEQGQGQFTYLRLADLSFDAPSLEVWIDGAPSDIQALSFGQVTGWIELPPDTYAISFVPVGQGGQADAGAAQADEVAQVTETPETGETPQADETAQAIETPEAGETPQAGEVEQAEPTALIGPVRYVLNPGVWNTLAIVGSAEAGTLTVQVLRENYTALAEGMAHVGFLNAISGAPNVDVVASDGTPLVLNLNAAGTSTDLNAGFVELDLPAGSYSFCLLPTLPQEPAGAAFVGVNQQFQGALDLFSQAQEFQQGGQTDQANEAFTQGQQAFVGAQQSFAAAQQGLGEQSAEQQTALNDFATAQQQFADAQAQGLNDQFGTAQESFGAAFNTFQTNPAFQAQAQNVQCPPGGDQTGQNRLVLAVADSVSLQPQTFYLILVFGTVDNPVVQVVESSQQMLTEMTNVTFGAAGQPAQETPQTDEMSQVTETPQAEETPLTAETPQPTATVQG